MFTGIVEAVGTIQAADLDTEGRHLRVGAPFASELTEGQSVSVNGVCLTVEAATSEAFEVFVSTETMARTYLGELSEGERVNLERGVTPGDRLDGHIVQGHVDATTDVRALTPATAVPSPSEDAADDWTLTVSLPAAIDRYVVEKGSIAVDGISLTVASLEEDHFTAAIIPETYHQTTLSEKAAGDPVHLEVDVLAKYVERLLTADESRV